VRGSGAEVPAAIWLSERRLTTGNGKGGRNEVRTRGERNSGSRTAGFAFGDLGMPPVGASRAYPAECSGPRRGIDPSYRALLSCF